MSMGGGGGQAMIQSGPSLNAAGAAAQSQVLAAQAASQAATQNTHAAIQALQGEYGTALTYANPIVNTGNQAAAQLNYMLGLGAVSPGASPTAPIMPTLQTAYGQLTPQQINQYIAANTFEGGYSTGSGNFGYSDYLGSYGNGTPTPTMAQNAYGSYGNTGIPTAGFIASAGPNGQYGIANAIANPNVQAGAAYDVATQNLQQNLLPQYQEQLTNYNQQLAQWQQENNLYNQYAAKGTATPADLTDIVQNLPGYQFQMGQGTNAIQNAASASGLLNSGALLQQLNQFGQGQASTYYNNYLNQLQQLAGYGAGATQQATSGAANLGNQIAGQYSNLGDAQANAYLAAGQAQASSYLTPLANQQTNITQIGGGGGSGWGSALGSVAGLLGKFL